MTQSTSPWLRVLPEVEEAIRLDIEAAVMDPDPHCACSGITLKFEQGGLLDKEAILAFGRKCEVLTIEIENVDASALKQLEEEFDQAA